jgi:ATP-dependent Clp protease ATP-binding subunit ClpC
MTIPAPMTDRAKRIIKLAEEFAATLGEQSTAGEHVLFALAAEGKGLAAHALNSLGTNAEMIRDCLRSLNDQSLPTPATDAAPALDQLQQWAQEELVPLGHNYVGGEHLLLAITHITSGRCDAVLTALKLDRKLIRDKVYFILGHIA